jgi:hypothetical protein
MSDKIYVVVHSGGSYEDAWSNNVAASTDRVKAEAFMAKEIAEQERHNESLKRIMEVEGEIVRDLGVAKYEHTLPYPKWKAGLGKEDITQEMRNDRLRVDLLNRQISERNNEMASTRFGIIKQRVQEMLRLRGYTEQDKLFIDAGVGWSVDRGEYNIEEVEVLA